MSYRRGIFTLVAAMAISALPQVCVAGIQTSSQTTQQTVTCTSSNNQRQYCRVNNYGVRITRRLSDASCDQNSSWGYDSGGVWVDQGCSAEFAVTTDTSGAYNNGQYDNNGAYNNQDSYGGPQTVRCTTRSRSTTRKYCAADTSGANVTLQRRTSNYKCTQGSSWGYDDEGIWVSRGCGGIFVVTPSNSGNDSGYTGGKNGYGQTIRCTARNGGSDRTYCQADTSRGVQLANQVSSNACTQDSTWGYDANGIWVSRGCSADFTLGGTASGYGRLHQRGQYGNGTTNSQTIRCEARDYSNQQQYCPADARGGVHIQRELSSNICRQGSNWGYDNGGIWVSNGCRADFEVDGTNQAYVGRTATMPAGTQVSIRADEAIDSKQAYAGQRYAADVAADVTDASGNVIIPRGSPAEMIIRDTNSSTNNGPTTNQEQNLVLDLNSVTVNSQRYVVSSEDITRSGGSGIGANKKTGEYVGGGALLGAIIGAVAGGGKGAAIGAAVGGAAGAGGVILTRGKAVNVPVETILNFKLNQDLTLQAVR